MQRFFEFVVNHWVLWSALIVILILLVTDELKARLSGLKRVKAQDLVQLLNREKAVVVDVRERKDYEQGHIVGAINFPVTEIDTHLNKLDKYKNKEIVVVDGAGQSFQAASKLRKQNFQVLILSGGLNAWRMSGLPLTKK